MNFFNQEMKKAAEQLKDSFDTINHKLQKITERLDTMSIELDKLTAQVKAK